MHTYADNEIRADGHATCDCGGTEINEAGCPTSRRLCEKWARPSQIPQLQPGMLRDPRQHLRPNFNPFVKCPHEIRMSGPLQCNVGRAFVRLRRPTDAQQSSINAIRLRTGPLAHAEAKLITLCPTFSNSIRSAITRSASASTAASASALVAP